MEQTIRLVICDIDGTLVGQDRMLTKAARAIIDRLHRQGVYFGVASGRPVDEVKNLLEKWQISAPFDILIGMNGAECYDAVQDRFSSYFKLPTEALQEIVEMMAPFGLNACVYQRGGMLCEREDEMIRQSVFRSGKKIFVAKKIGELYSEPNAKIMFRCLDPDRLSAAEKFAHEQNSPIYKAFRTGPRILEFADRRISKAYALKKFCESNGFSLQNVLAFGDTSNDNEMLKESGWGVCLCNGSEDTKAAADEITEKSNDEDGFADYMEKRFFQTKPSASKVKARRQLRPAV